MTTHQKAVLITGASSGIGKACALYLDNLGFKVCAGVRKEDDREVFAEVATDRLTPYCGGTVVTLRQFFVA